MTEILTLSFASAVVYMLIRMIETKFVNKDDKPVKILLKDSLFVFIGVYLAGFAVDQLSSDIGLSGGKISSQKTPAFVGDPNF